MPRPRLFADVNRINPRYWTWQERLAAFAIAVATIAILGVLAWPLIKLLVGS